MTVISVCGHLILINDSLLEILNHIYIGSLHRLGPIEISSGISQSKASFAYPSISRSQHDVNMVIVICVRLRSVLGVFPSARLQYHGTDWTYRLQ
jgi:hypothetical protein